MPGHLSSIGLPVKEEADLAVLADRIGPLATPGEASGGTYWRWSSECGAEVWLQADTNGDLVGLTPFFSGDARIRVRLTARVARPGDTPLEGAFHGWADPDDGVSESGAYPFVFDAVDYANYSEVSLPAIVTAQIAAFAHEVSVYPTVDAYDASQTDGLKFASRSFVPSGLFSPNGEMSEPPGSMAIFTGHVVATERKTNSLTGARYDWARVDTLGGSFDVLIDPELCDSAPVAGGVISGLFWLCGRLVS